MIGKKLSNRYEIIERLGSGGMSIVYKGLDTVLNRLVTIKVLREQYASDEDFVRRFRREAQSVASLSHINIVSIFDVGSEDDLHYLVMEYVEGNNLKEYIREKGILPVEEAVPIAIQILEGLQHAHEHGVVHRDIKPHNILITKDGRVKVTDFGIARAASEATVTYSGAIVGSVHYISPEQAKGISIGAKSDIYAAGVVLFEMLTGQLPFTGDSPIAVALQHIQNEPKSPNEIVKEIPPELSYVIRRAMAKNPDQRYNSAREMRRDLQKISAGSFREIDMRPDSSQDEDTVIISGLDEKAAPRRRKRVKRRYKWVLALMGILVLLAVMWAGYSRLISFLDVEETTVPPLEGKPIDEAKKDLEAAGLKYDLEYAFNDTVKKDFVIFQDISAGQVVKKSRVVGLIVSQGPELTVVPDLRGKTKREVEVELSNSRLQGTFSEDFSNNIPQGLVISQKPDSKTQVPENTVVSVVISAGVEPKYIPAPDLVNKTLEDAEKILAENGLELGEVTQQESKEFFAWEVISQDPGTGTLILEGDPVNLVVSQGPGPVAQIARVTYEIPEDNKEHRLQIIVKDDRGSHQEYDRIQQPGDLVVQDVPFYGTGKIGIYLDGEMVYGQDVP